MSKEDGLGSGAQHERELLPIINPGPGVWHRAGSGDSHLDVCFGFVEQTECCVPGAVWAQRDQNFQAF